MNHKGAVALVGIMIAVLMVIVVIAMSPSIKEQVGIARTSLDCTNTSLSPGQTGTCIITDWTYTAYFGIGLAAALTWLGVRNFFRSRREGV